MARTGLRTRALVHIVAFDVGRVVLDAQKPEKPASDLSLDSIAEDLFGLNIRGVKSIYTAWRRPRDYFAAAKSPDWHEKFTPSMRLWLSFFALFSALKFWWFGTNEGMIGAFATGFENAGLALTDGLTYRDVGAEAVLWVFGWIPILQIVSMIILAMLYRAWGERTTLALRQRYLFIVMIPSASMMPVFLTIMLFVPPSLISLYGVFLAFAAFIIDFQTGYRGGFASASAKGRALRAGILAFVLVSINTLTTIAAQIVGIIVISQKYGVSAIP